MADLRDEHGNPVQLTDGHGNPVQLTDEHGNPMHITGLATKHDTTVGSGVYTVGAPAGSEARGGEVVAAIDVISSTIVGVSGPTGPLAADQPPAGTYGTTAAADQPHQQAHEDVAAAAGEHRRPSSSSSSSVSETSR